MSLMKKAIGGSIHRIREFELEKVNLIDEFDILQIVGEGWFGKILLTEHRSTQTEMVLKALPKAYTGLSDFFREFHYGLHLAAHRNIITTYDVAFETAGFYVFSQEYAPLGDLTSNVTETGLGELHAKRVARQLAAAVHHIHSRELVHRDIKLDNVLVFRSDFSRIKLCDFGETRRVNTVVRRHNEWLPYSPPEVLQIDTDETYKCLTSHDVWQFGIVLFVCLTGCLPWQKAAMDDPRYTRYQNWHSATLNIAKKPKLFQLISSRAQRMFKRLLDPRAEKRPVSVLEINKYLEDRWLAKLGAEKALNGGADERDELCPSMYSFHSSLEEKNQLLHTLTTYGIETTVDRTKKKDRIREWIQASTIAEEYEEDESDLNEESRFHEDEEEEPASMKGRHFPETRPRATANDTRKNSRTHTSSARKRLPVKPTERKIPFAPQVAEERETVARFASFPNGDPNLATLKNGANGTTESESPIHSNPVATRAESTPVEGRSSIVNVNGRTTTRSSPSSSVNTSQDGTTTNTNLQQATSPTSGETSQLNNNVQEQALTAVGDDRIVAKNPEIPTRKHRSQTAPFAIPTSPYLNGNRRETAKRSHSASTLTERSAAALPVARGEKSSAIMLPTRADNQPAGMSRSERSPTASHSENRSAGGGGSSGAVIARPERPPVTGQSMSRVENQSAAMLPAARVENQLANTSPITRNETSPPRTMQAAPVNPLTMSVASHLVMQSFNALQGINPLTPTKSTDSTTVSSNVPGNSATTPTNRSPAGTPVRNTTPPTTKKSPRPEEFISYGKDAYEHYGIAQGVILRTGNTRQGSSGSPSRSISN